LPPDLLAVFTHGAVKRIFLQLLFVVVGAPPTLAGIFTANDLLQMAA